MSKITPFPNIKTDSQALDAASPKAVALPAMANRITTVLIQQALDDACVSKDWKTAKHKINIAIKRGHMHIVRG